VTWPIIHPGPPPRAQDANECLNELEDQWEGQRLGEALAALTQHIRSITPFPLTASSTILVHFRTVLFRLLPMNYFALGPGTKLLLFIILQED